MGVFKIKNKQLNLLKPKIAFLSWYEYSTWLFIITNDVVIYRYRYLYRDNADTLKPCRRWICKKKNSLQSYSLSPIQNYEWCKNNTRLSFWYHHEFARVSFLQILYILVYTCIYHWSRSLKLSWKHNCCDHGNLLHLFIKQ